MQNIKGNYDYRFSAPQTVKRSLSFGTNSSWNSSFASVVKRFILFLLGNFIFLVPSSAWASQLGVNAWEQILTKISTSLTGPVAYSLAVIAIVVCGLSMAFTDLQGGAKRLVQAACGLSIAFFAVQITTQFLGFSGAVI